MDWTNSWCYFLINSAFLDLDGKPEFSPELRNNSIDKLEHELELEHDFEEELRIELELQKLSADTDRITVEDLLLVYKKKGKLQIIALSNIRVHIYGSPQ